MASQQNSDLLHRTLRECFSLTKFRPGQLDAVLATLSGSDSLVILPTGGGKSVCFQLPCMTREYGFTVVVCPLIALAKDQVDKCDERGIYAERWNCEVAEPRKISIAKDMASDEPSLRLLYTTPESLRHPKLLESLKEAGTKGTLVSFAIDEAHTVSEWGHDFRPAYLELSCIKREFPSVPITALTASATAKVKDDIISVLGLRSPVLIQGSFNRPNITYEVRHRELIGDGSDPAVLEDLVKFIEARRDECGIIYARLRGTCDWLSSALAARDIDVGCYHAGRGTDARSRVQRDWSSGGLNVVVATIAFGMGIDRADVRWVVHWNAPASMEGFYQESGRAGRDGQPSLSILYASHADLQNNHKMERGARTGAVAEVAGYAHGAGCRRRHILKFFGEQRGPCNPGCDQLCDACTDPAAVRRALSRLEQREAEQGSKAAAVRARMMGIRVAANNPADTENGEEGGDDGRGTGAEPRSAAAAWSRASTYSAAVQPAGGSCPREPGPAPPGDEPGACSGASVQAGVGSNGVAGGRRPLVAKRPISALGHAPGAVAPATTSGEPRNTAASSAPQASDTAVGCDGTDGSLLRLPEQASADDVNLHFNLDQTGAGGAVEPTCIVSANSASAAAYSSARQPLLKRPRPGVLLPFKAPARVQLPGDASGDMGSTAACQDPGRPGSTTDKARGEAQGSLSCGARHQQPAAQAGGLPLHGPGPQAGPGSTSATGVTCSGGPSIKPVVIKRRAGFKPPSRVNPAETG